MKPNLQTFPKESPYDRANSYTRNVLKWKRDFEKELQQLDKLAYHELPDYCLADEHGTYIRIDEILGTKP